MLKGSLGTGVLAMPNAFNNSGLVVGTIGTILIGSVCTYCLHVLVGSRTRSPERMLSPRLPGTMSNLALCFPVALPVHPVPARAPAHPQLP